MRNNSHFFEEVKMDIRDLTGVGMSLEKKLNEIGIFTTRDLLLYFPKKFTECNLGIEEDKITCIGTVVSEPKTQYIRRNLNRMSFYLEYENKNYLVSIFNRNFLKKHLTVQKKILVIGKLNNDKITAADIKFKYEKIILHYDLGTITLKTFQKSLKLAVEKQYDNLEESLPNYLLEKYKLINLKQLVRVAHAPNNFEEIRQFYRRNKYQELLYYQIQLQFLNKEKMNNKGIKVDVDKDYLNELYQQIPFELTTSQVATLEEILKDLKKDTPMVRLVQGDVGSGKTIVSFLASLIVNRDSYQSVLMAPTEVLASQHFNNFQKYFNSEQVALLSSSIKAKQRKQILENLANGKILFLIGTHAIFQKEVIYKNLGLAIIDEQHRFGVNQRNLLNEKGDNPNLLYLTATPIPRTLASAIFYDLDVSNILSIPTGRKKIITKYLKYNKIDSAFDKINEQILKNRQVFIIAPLVNESEKLDYYHIDEVCELVKNKINVKYGVLHGKMTNDEKDEVLRKFKEKKFNCLIATTVVEVGLDFKDATVMLILDAERYGLSQLHQLRGRVGRGDYQSYCYLVSDKSTKRLKIIEEIDDGFKLSEEDLKLRGPGDYLGIRQSGIPMFKYANLKEDLKILTICKEDASKIVYNIDDKNNFIFKKYLEKLRRNF